MRERESERERERAREREREREHHGELAPARRRPSWCHVRVSIDLSALLRSITGQQRVQAHLLHGRGTRQETAASKLRVCLYRPFPHDSRLLEGGWIEGRTRSQDLTRTRTPPLPGRPLSHSPSPSLSLPPSLSLSLSHPFSLTLILFLILSLSLSLSLSVIRLRSIFLSAARDPCVCRQQQPVKRGHHKHTPVHIVRVTPWW